MIITLHAAIENADHRLFDLDVEGTGRHVLTISQEITADYCWDTKVGQAPPNDPTGKGQ